MKLGAGKRILMFFHWLLSLLICAAFAIYLVRREWLMNLYNKVAALLNDRQILIIGIAILGIYVILCVWQACLIFHRTKRNDRGFITMDSNDSGHVRIAISAIEEMVRQAVTSIEGIAEMKISIDNLDDAIAINLNCRILNGYHVPTITVNMQRSIRQFVEMNCGVAVRTVTININGVTSGEEPSKYKKRQKGSSAFSTASPAADHRNYSVVDDAVNDIKTNAETAVETAKPDFVIPDPEPIRLHLYNISESVDNTLSDSLTEEAEEPARNENPE